MRAGPGPVTKEPSPRTPLRENMWIQFWGILLGTVFVLMFALSKPFREGILNKVNTVFGYALDKADMQPVFNCYVHEAFRSTQHGQAVWEIYCSKGTTIQFQDVDMHTQHGVLKLHKE